MHLTRRVAVLACLAVLCASPAMARRVSTPVEESLSRSQPPTPIGDVAAPNVNHPAKSNSDDPPACVVPPTRATSFGRSEASRMNAPDSPRVPATPALEPERREKVRPAAPVMGPRAVRPLPVRLRLNMSRPVPATPGMGTLLRMGMTMGREIS